MNAAKSKPRLEPYQLASAQYAVWERVGQQLGMNAKVAVEQYLCSGQKIIPPYGGKLDEQSVGVIRTIANQQNVFIPRWALEEANAA
ncbi:MAG: hypothetical protein RLZZ416_291 [Candidatus Parcubacteria bacterium]|jgi:hypothetical protein